MPCRSVQWRCNPDLAVRYGAELGETGQYRPFDITGADQGRVIWPWSGPPQPKIVGWAIASAIEHGLTRHGRLQLTGTQPQGLTQILIDALNHEAAILKQRDAKWPLQLRFRGHSLRGTGESTASNLIDAMNHDAASLTHVTRQGAPLADWASGLDAPE
jgi:hypothetical protein